MNPDWFIKTIYSIIQKNPKIDLDEKKIESLISHVIEKTLPQTSNILLESLKTDSSNMLEEHRLCRVEFEARLQRKWSKPINLLETLLVISRESGELCCNECLEKAKEEENIVFQVLVRIHARACQIACEILCLLRGGFADGAITRWRTLHELSVLAFFISENSNEVAKMYLEYEYIEKYKEMLEYNKHAPKLGYKKLTREERYSLTNIKNELIAKYGPDYEKPFGWTMKVLSKENRNFKEIESYIKLDYLRPYYKLACNYVHLGPKASSCSLGTIEGMNILLSGASNYGLADPGQNTSIAVTQISTCLLTIYPSYERLMVAEVMSLLVKEICESFVDVQKNIESEELTLQKLKK